jgi:hypothetical protein
MHYRYFIYGLTVRVPFPCLMLSLAPPDAIPTVIVEDGEVPSILADATLIGDGWQAAPGKVLMQGSDQVARFLVEGGEHVTLQRAQNVTDEVLAVQFLDAALAFILQQRGFVVLHGNAVATRDGAVALCGASGVGKSTALTALIGRGYAMLTDDITACCQRDDGMVTIVPGMPHLHLCAHAAEHLGKDISGLPRYPWRRMKAVVPTRAAMAHTPTPLRKLYVLRTYDGDAVSAQPLYGAEKFSIVQQQLYGPLRPPQHVALFPLLAKLVRQTKVFILSRPAHRWAVEEIVNIILQ